MTHDNFPDIQAEFKAKIDEWTARYNLAGLSCYKNTSYPLKRTIVYNKQFEEIESNEIKMILVGDNPGMDEQQQNAYLIGKSGKMAGNFFKQNFEYDFYAEVLILNKTPIHTKSTQQLSEINKAYPGFIEESQRYMAELVYRIAVLLEVPVYITGFAGCRTSDGIWLKKGRNGYNLNSQTTPYFFEELRNLFLNNRDLLMLFKHFSYGNFARDLKSLVKKGVSVKDAVYTTGQTYARELLDSFVGHE